MADKTTYEMLHEEAVGKAAVFLKQNWGDINALVAATASVNNKSYTAPNPPDFKTIAQGLIDNGNIQGVSIQELDSQLDKKDSEKRLKKSFGVESLEELVPHKSDLEKVAQVIDSRNPENQKTNGFWENIVSFFSNIGKYIAGFFNWITNGFDGGFEGLGKYIKAEFVNGMAGEVKSYLQTVDSKFLKGRGGANIEMIAQSVEQKGKEKIGLRQKSEGISLDDVKQGEVGGATREAIRLQIEKETKELTLKKFDEKVKEKTNFFTKWLAGKDIGSARTKVADTVASVVSEVMTSAEHDQKTTAEKIELVKTELETKLKALKISYLDDETIKGIVKDTGEALAKNQDIQKIESIFSGGELAANSIPAMNQSLQDFENGRFKGEETGPPPFGKQQINVAHIG